MQVGRSANRPRRVDRAYLDFLAALESGEHGERLARFWADDVRTLTHPNLVAPRGGLADRAAMLAASVAGAGLLVDQRYDVRELDEVGDTVVVRLEWSGELAVELGPWPAGTRPPSGPGPRSC